MKFPDVFEIFFRYYIHFVMIQIFYWIFEIIFMVDVNSIITNRIHYFENFFEFCVIFITGLLEFQL